VNGKTFLHGKNLFLLSMSCEKNVYLVKNLFTPRKGFCRVKNFYPSKTFLPSKNPVKTFDLFTFPYEK